MDEPESCPFVYRAMGSNYPAHLGAIDGPDAFFLRLEQARPKTSIVKDVQVWLGCGACRKCNARPTAPAMVIGTVEEKSYWHCINCKAKWPPVDHIVTPYRSIQPNQLEEWLEVTTQLTPLELPIGLYQLQSVLSKAVHALQELTRA